MTNYDKSTGRVGGFPPLSFTPHQKHSIKGPSYEPNALANSRVLLGVSRLDAAYGNNFATPLTDDTSRNHALAICQALSARVSFFDWAFISFGRRRTGVFREPAKPPDLCEERRNCFTEFTFTSRITSTRRTHVLPADCAGSTRAC